MSKSILKTPYGLSNTTYDSSNHNNHVEDVLEWENHTPRDLYDQAMQTLDPVGGVLSINDTVIEKSANQYIHPLNSFWSNQYHKAVQGLSLMTLFYIDKKGNSLAVNYRVYDHNDRKTQNNYFLGMLEDVLEWGLSPSFITGDSRYSLTKNLESVRHRGLGFMFEIQSDCIVSVANSKSQHIETVAKHSFKHQPVWLENFGLVRLFRMCLQNQIKHYVLFDPHDFHDRDDGSHITQFDFLHDTQWEIEHFHQVSK